ncbi:hypothetical protein [Halostella litorea]|uniref:hypothetical protein n=1 Tax=Halostella litorea TaxID=2528831 RepID=UPI001092549C|nr:hypothetical protein [Halostella litorea]
MIEWESTESGVRAVGDDADLAVTAPEFELLAADAALPRRTDAALAGSAAELGLPSADVAVTSLATGERRDPPPALGRRELPPDEYVVEATGDIEVVIRFEGAAAVRTDDGGTVVSFPERRRCGIGFRAPDGGDPETLRVPPTPSGLATALTHLSAAHGTTGPERSYPALRDHPPLVETAETVRSEHVPDAVAAATPETGIEVAAPASFPDLFVLAPLAYYLGANVVTEPRSAPVVRAPAADVEVELDPLPELERSAPRLLRKAFFLDCLVRDVGPRASVLAERNLLDALDLDADEIAALPPAERLARYVEVPYGAIERRLPDWHLATYVEPRAERVACLPYLLDDMSLIYRPRTSELEGTELVERSLDDFYRQPSPGSGQVASVDVVKPELRTGRIHGWLSDGVPIDVFKSTLAAHENRLDYRDGDDGPTSVTVVLNDGEMADEHDEVERIYRERAEDIPLDLTVRRRLPRAELADVFESRLDFVHYIGHCEREGLCCPDGHLAAGALDDCNVETFFLNACGSYHEGMTLVEKGAVAGAVTFSEVLDDHAATVGSTFARLLVHGFCIERALRLSRRRILMGKDYAVVGDGTHVLTGGRERPPATVRLQRVDGGFLLSYDQFSPGNLGAFYRPQVGDGEYAYLCGNESEFVLDRDATRAFLRDAELPVVHDGDVYWSGSLARSL